MLAVLACNVAVVATPPEVHPMSLSQKDTLSFEVHPVQFFLKNCPFNVKA